MKKVYYPLSPVKGIRKPRAPVVTFLAVLPGPDGAYQAGAMIGIDGELTQVTAPDVITMLKGLPSKSWVITYDLEQLESVTGPLLSAFQIEIYNSSSVTLKRRARSGGEKEQQILSVIDLKADFTDTFKNVCKKFGVEPLPVPGPASSQAERADYIAARVRMIRNIYQRKDAGLMENFYTHPGKAPGSTALKTFSRSIDGPVKPRGKIVQRITENTNRAAALHWTPAHYSQVWQYDINAAYPFVMGRTLYPEHPKIFSRRAPYCDHFIAVMKINYTCRARFSPLTVMIKGLEKFIIHPERVRGLRCTLTYIDIETLKRFGEFEVVEWIEGVEWAAYDEKPVFEKWAGKVEKMSENPLDKLMVKSWSRALHSKFDQRGYTVTKYKKVNKKQYESMVKGGKVLDVILLDEGGIAVKYSEYHRSGFRPYYRPDWEALTLSAARALVYSAVDEDTVYIDTDCIISTRERADLPLSARFGDWKLQQSGFCTISGPRVYQISGKVKASGIHAEDPNQLKNAIIRAGYGEVTQVDAAVKGFLFSGQGERVSAFTIKKITYPRAEILGLRAYVTRSPTKLFKLKSIRRRLSRRPPNY